MRKLATAVGVFLFFSCLIDISARAKRRDKIEGGEKQKSRRYIHTYERSAWISSSVGRFSFSNFNNNIKTSRVAVK